MLIRTAGPVAQYIVARELVVHFPLLGRSRETRLVRLVHHSDDPTSIANRLVSGDLFDFESLEKSRNERRLEWRCTEGISWRIC